MNAIVISNLNRKLILILFYIIIFPVLILADTDHLIFSRIVLAPDKAEMVEIINPTNDAVNLENYYLTDATSSSDYYYNIRTGTDFWSGDFRDFIIRFPSYNLGSGDTIIIGMNTSEEFTEYFNYVPDFALGDGDLLDAIDTESTIGIGAENTTLGMLHDNQETLVLFYWDGIESSLIKDVDYFLWNGIDYNGSNPSEHPMAINKPTEDGYNSDTPKIDQSYRRYHGNDSSFVRISISESENQFGGNGITGHDETSENFLESWNIIPNPEVLYGCTDPDAINYNPLANVDDNSCHIAFIDIINGLYDNQTVTVQGVVVDYFDVTVYGGPHAITIEDENGYRIELVVWPDSWDILDGNLTLQIGDTDIFVQCFEIITAPFNRFVIQATALVGEYDGEKQLDVLEYNNLSIIQIFDKEGEFFPIEVDKVSIKPEPYVIIPSLGETLDFTYSFPENSRVILRVFDISGRYITSLVNKYREDSGTINRTTSISAWDGRDITGQIVSPGTYLFHIEAINFSTGKTTWDVAPVVVGVRP